VNCSAKARADARGVTIHARAILCLACLILTTSACAPRKPAEAAGKVIDAPRVFRPEGLAALDEAIEAAITNGAAPGAVLWLERNGVVHERAFGRRAVLPEPEPMTRDTVFDAASLTKVLATTPAIMALVEDGRLDIQAPVRTYLPSFTGDGRDAITVRHLLTHTSGLRPGIPLRPDWEGYDAGIQRALQEKPEGEPDSRFRYSDVNFILLGEIVARVSGMGLDEFCATRVYAPLGMTNTTFRPPETWKDRTAPTTLVNGAYLRATVHDPTARRMGGVAGHAGLFTTAEDVARFARMMIQGGTLDGRRVFKEETVRMMTSVHTPERLANARRGLGWDIDSPYAGPRGEHFPVGSYGHTGWTGTSVWIDPFSRAFVILMSNRNHPTEDGNVIGLRRRVGTLAAEAIEGFNFAGVPGALPRQSASGASRTNSASAGEAAAPTLNGIDVLIQDGFQPLKKKRIGLITNHTGTDRERNSTIDILHRAADVDLRALFSPEHGIRGQLDEKVPDGTDPATGLPVYSLYGEVRQPRDEQLRDLDALVFDVQDIGCRFYTYISTLGLCLEAAAKRNLEFIVLDRVNPIDASVVEGPVYTGTNSHFVAYHQIPLRHGMTVGELARMFNAERNLNARLTVIPVKNWRRSQWFDETGLPWINTSPNMRNLTQAILYPGVGLVEFAVSVGRGFDTPFEVVGAPYVDDVQLATELNRAGLPGIRFIPIRFTPKASVFKDKPCGGVYLLLTDRDQCPVVDVGILLAMTLHRLYPNDFDLQKVEVLLRSPSTLEAIRAGKSLTEIKAGWSMDLAEFQARRGPFLLY
jgi:uncharacterized protein YbbC (DUF1343 family)/CubicO group peptidase (beta-lactamase class C family)